MCGYLVSFCVSSCRKSVSCQRGHDSASVVLGWFVKLILFYLFLLLPLLPSFTSSWSVTRTPRSVKEWEIERGRGGGGGSERERERERESLFAKMFLIVKNSGRWTPRAENPQDWLKPRFITWLLLQTAGGGRPTQRSGAGERGTEAVGWPQSRRHKPAAGQRATAGEGQCITGGSGRWLWGQGKTGISLWTWSVTL